MSQQVWKPLEPGWHEHEHGSVHIDEDYFFTRVSSMKLSQIIAGGNPDAIPFRLCQLVTVPDAPSVSVSVPGEVVEAIGAILPLASARSEGYYADRVDIILAWLERTKEGK